MAVKPHFTVCGSVEPLLSGLPNTTPEQLVGLPINDENGKRIGVITSVDGKFWNGKFDDPNYGLKKLTTSMELSVSHNERPL